MALETVLSTVSNAVKCALLKTNIFKGQTLRYHLRRTFFKCFTERLKYPTLRRFAYRLAMKKQTEKIRRGITVNLSFQST